MTHKKQIDDRFERFGVKSFTAVSKVNNFVDRLESGNVSGTKCKTCGLVFFPPRADCCQCLSEEMEWFDIKGAGRLISFSMLKYAPAGFEADTPYAVALVDFKTCKVFGRITKDISEENLKIGMQMTVAVRRLENDKITYEFHHP
jgi:uncharacterized OB-fold protein